jgi:hypothetical protein
VLLGSSEFAGQNSLLSSCLLRGFLSTRNKLRETKKTDAFTSALRSFQSQIFYRFKSPSWTPQYSQTEAAFSGPVAQQFTQPEGLGLNYRLIRRTSGSVNCQTAGPLALMLTVESFPWA